ncbi:glutathione S-transferase U17-like [Carex rostrata]
MAAIENSEVKLLGVWVSPFVIRVGIALNLKEVQYEFLEEQFGTKSELLLKSNPVYKKIPVLIHHGKPISESMIIVQYIDDIWAQSASALMPTDTYDKAMHRFWTAYFDDKFYNSLFGLVTTATEETKVEAVEQIMTVLLHLEEAFAKMSKGKPFFGGDTIKYLDIAVGSFLGWMRAAEEIMCVKLLDDARLPLLCAWAENFCNNEAVRTVIPETAKFVEFGKILQAKFKSGPPPAK